MIFDNELYTRILIIIFKDRKMVKVKTKVVLFSQLARSMTKHSIDCELNSQIFCRFLRL